MCCNCSNSQEHQYNDEINFLLLWKCNRVKKFKGWKISFKFHSYFFVCISAVYYKNILFAIHTLSPGVIKKIDAINFKSFTFKWIYFA